MKETPRQLTCAAGQCEQTALVRVPASRRLHRGHCISAQAKAQVLETDQQTVRGAMRRGGHEQRHRRPHRRSVESQSERGYVNTVIEGESVQNYAHRLPNGGHNHEQEWVAQPRYIQGSTAEDATSNHHSQENDYEILLGCIHDTASERRHQRDRRAHAGELCDTTS